MTSPDQPRLIFITGTDTGVGKTVLTSLLLCHWRAAGCPALAIKPFCSGGRADAELLCGLQDDELTLDEINPFHFPEPIAPLVAARKHRRKIKIQDVFNHVRRVAASLVHPSIHRSVNPRPVLLIEGAGGLLSPLGEGLTALDLVGALRCETIVVSRNKLGTINHTLLTVKALRAVAPSAPRRSRPLVRVVLMGARTEDFSSASNAAILKEQLAPVPLVGVPHLGRRCSSAAAIRRSAREIKKILQRIIS